jgi:hypothetical protein
MDRIKHVLSNRSQSDFKNFLSNRSQSDLVVLPPDRPPKPAHLVHFLPEARSPVARCSFVTTLLVKVLEKLANASISLFNTQTMHIKSKTHKQCILSQKHTTALL